MANTPAIAKHHFVHSSPTRPRYFVVAAVIVVGEDPPPRCPCAACKGEPSERTDRELPSRAA